MKAAAARSDVVFGTISKTTLQNWRAKGVNETRGRTNGMIHTSVLLALNLNVRKQMMV